MIAAMRCIFKSKHSEPSSAQSTPMIMSLIDLMDDFATSTAVSTDHDASVLNELTLEERKLVQNACEAMRGVETNCFKLSFDVWMPEFGCVLVSQELHRDCSSLSLIGLDGWTFYQHSLPEQVVKHSASPSQYPQIHCGRLKSESKHDFYQKFNQHMAKVQTRTGERRHARNPDGGCQKTPTFVLAQVQWLLTNRSESIPLGGMTDVGLHTGGSRRNTCWPLIRGALGYLLCDRNYLIEKVILQFQLYCLALTTGKLKETASADEFEFWQQMLTEIVENAVALGQRGFDVTFAKEKCTELSNIVVGMRENESRALVASYTFSELRDSHENLDVDSVQMIEAIVIEETMEMMRNRALAGIGFKRLYRDNSFSSVLNWVKTGDSKSEESLVLKLRSIESFMCQSVKLLLKPGSVSADDVVTLCEIIFTRYQTLLQTWIDKVAPNSLLHVQQRSREMLMYWIACCLAYHSCCGLFKNPDFKEYGLPLNWKDLKYLVLGEKREIDAALSIAHYLKNHAKPVSKTLFLIENKEGILEYALKYAQQSNSMNERHEVELNNVNRRKEKHWQQVQQKKTQAASIRTEIDTVDVEITALQERLDWLYCQRYRHGNKIYVCQRDLNRSQNRKNDLNRELGGVLQPPHPVITPIPQKRDTALRVIFFLEMPETMNQLSQLCYESQSMLARGAADNNSICAGPEFTTTFASHYTIYGAKPEADKNMILYPYHFQIPKSIGPQSVDNIYSSDSCTWYPDFPLELAWKHRTFGSYNPFKAPSRWAEAFYTEELPDKSLQWANEYPGGLDRGNVVYSKFPDQPKEFRKPSFIAFGNIRSTPNQQFRKITCALLQSSGLPLGNENVRTVCRQALYQIGELVIDDAPRLLWKTDMLSQEGLDTIRLILNSLLDKLKDKIREHSSLLLLGELASYFSQFDSATVQLVRSYAKTLIGHANSSSKSRSFQGQMYGSATLCYIYLDLELEDAAALARLIVLFQNRLGFSDESCSLKRMQWIVREVVSTQIVSLLQYIEDGEAWILTKALESILERTPEKLEWRKLKPEDSEPKESCCFEASCSGQHYSLNLLTGYVLVNGYPPSRLPREVRKHPMYNLLFGDRDFEVSRAGAVFSTMQPFHGYHYDFEVRDTLLILKEIDSKNSISDLLDRTIGRNVFPSLPERLYRLHSRWYMKDLDIVVFRPLDMIDKTISFFIDCSNQRCYQVTRQSQESSAEKLYEKRLQFDYFVPAFSEIVQVLTKFEAEKYIHCLRTPKGERKIHLPRFHLNFVQNQDGRFESLEFRRYFLSNTQQMDQFLPTFTTYLVLNAGDSKRYSDPALKLVVPCGKVKSELGRCVIQINDEDEQAKYIVFDQHQRFKTFVAGTLGGRLQLVAIYVCAGTTLKDGRLGMTGPEAALEILRQCWSNKPLSENELEQLKSIVKYSHREPALTVLAEAFYTETERLNFMFDVPKTEEKLRIDSSAAATDYSAYCSREYDFQSCRRLAKKKKSFCISEVNFIDRLE